MLLLQRGRYTAGKDTLFDELLTAAGGRNVAAEAGFSGHVPLSFEQVLSLDPDVLLYCGYRADARARSLAEIASLAQHPALAHLSAVRNGKVLTVPPRILMTTSHHVVLAARTLAALLHPEKS